jgi:hypothetical protein
LTYKTKVQKTLQASFQDQNDIESNVVDKFILDLKISETCMYANDQKSCSSTLGNVRTKSETFCTVGIRCMKARRL